MSRPELPWRAPWSYSDEVDHALDLCRRDEAVIVTRMGEDDQEQDRVEVTTARLDKLPADVRAIFDHHKLEAPAAPSPERILVTRERAPEGLEDLVFVFVAAPRASRIMA
jgi:hypothetical protein